MRKIFYFFIRQVLVAVCLFSLSSCALTSGRSPDTSYYLLTLPAKENNLLPDKISGLRVGIDLVNIPAYLDRVQIVIRKGDSPRIILSEYDLWGENLQNAISRFLAEKISQILAHTGGVARPASRTIDFDILVHIGINRLDGAPGSTILLDANWDITDRSGKVLQEGNFISSTTAYSGMEGLVTAHGELIVRFGEELAGVILAQKEPPK